MLHIQKSLEVSKYMNWLLLHATNSILESKPPLTTTSQKLSSYAPPGTMHGLGGKDRLPIVGDIVHCKNTWVTTTTNDLILMTDILARRPNSQDKRVQSLAKLRGGSLYIVGLEGLK